MKTIKTLIFAALGAVMVSCQSEPRAKFNAITNFGSADTILLDMDLTDAYTQGICLPSARQTGDGGFIFSFNGTEGQYYKIYYQNESYKFGEGHQLDNENFYGSWEDSTIGFKRIAKSGIVTDTFRIVGNPRNERKYFGSDISENPYNDNDIDEIMGRISKDSSWYAYVSNKAIEKKTTVEEQMFADAQWIINGRRNNGNTNNRWKRNPRVGCYSFMLVVCDKDALDRIPEHIQFINKTNQNGSFENPYSYFKKNRKNGIKVLAGDKILKTRAVITPKNGIFVNELKTSKRGYTPVPDNPMCNNSDSAYHNALFQQFFSSISQQYTLRNIPLIKDVVSDSTPYTRAEYDNAYEMYDSTQLQYNYPVVSDYPGKTVRVTDGGKSIKLINPASTPGNLKKESTGIQTRIGFTYGKFRGKIKFPEMLNDENIWNGLTYAFWLIYQDEDKWNYRRPTPSGYIRKSDDSENPERTNDVSYSEIDIEIVKASKYWTQSYYHGKDKQSHVEDATQNSDVMYCCTNWDLANTDPKRFDAGITPIKYAGKEFEAMRWYKNYKALTTKHPISNNVFKADYQYYEIEWRPNEIIWRIGPSPDKMEVVGYISDEYSNIPDNQMLCIITQEYHYSEWWPPVVFEQGRIPYNKTDIVGEVFEIVVE